MTPVVARILEDVAAAHFVAPQQIIGRNRSPRVVLARMDATHRMVGEGGCTPRQIARILQLDHTTVYFYLGRLSKKPKVPKLRWRTPNIAHLSDHCSCQDCTQRRAVERYARKRLNPRPKFLVPYAGADWRDYVWKPRRYRNEHC